ncbi:tyrosine-type recombinase/integrase [Kribbella deserti]|uniref:Tyrosine-type recombinase/integrase n=1 Tax=Kribbella deserti TaxID=1926257 RepID=A0ABV6QDY6_9ACTN
MARSLGLGEHGEIEAVPQKRDTAGSWKRAPNARSAGRWRARGRVKGYDGTTVDISRFGQTKRAAIEAVEQAIEEHLRGGENAITASMTVVAAGRYWIEQISRTDSKLSENTVRDYKGGFRRYVEAEGSTIRGLTLRQANDPQRLLAFLQKVADNHGTGAAHLAKSVVSGIIRMAVEAGPLTSNAMLQVRKVKSQTPKVVAAKDQRDHQRAFTAEERDIVLAYADEYARRPGLDPRTVRKWEAVADLLAFMAGTGVRIDEARSIRWDQLYIQDSQADIHGTKTLGSRRMVPLPDWLAARMQARAERLGTEGLVFAAPSFTKDHDRKWSASNSNKAVRVILNGAGMSWAISHTFRRTVATRLDKAGVALSDIADQLGHADPSMTAKVYLGRDFMGNRSHIATHL